MDFAVRFATADFPYSKECQCLGMAIQGAVMIRKGPNRDNTLHWFHAFVYSVLAGFAGGWLGFVFMGKPSSMLASDVNFGSCIIAYILVNWTPYDIGYKLCQTLPVTMLYTSFAQLFRSNGIMGFVNACYAAFKDSPSPYYPMPVFGPILYATLLGNMGGFIMKGLEGHVQNGVPWPVQNGFFVASFYHFFVHDTEGPIGKALRAAISSETLFGLDTAAFAALFACGFMQIMGMLHLPQFIGPQFTPFGSDLLNPWKDSAFWQVGLKESEFSKKKEEQTNGAAQTQTHGAVTDYTATKKSKKQKNKKTQ